MAVAFAVVAVAVSPFRLAASPAPVPFSLPAVGAAVVAAWGLVHRRAGVSSTEPSCSVWGRTWELGAANVCIRQWPDRGVGCARQVPLPTWPSLGR